MLVWNSSETEFHEKLHSYTHCSLYRWICFITFSSIYKVKIKTNQKQLLQQGMSFLSFGDIKKNVQENTTNTIN